MRACMCENAQELRAEIKALEDQVKAQRAGIKQLERQVEALEEEEEEELIHGGRMYGGGRPS
jgi:predicted RNase H-like nuclease (RuvC/YqgF family)